MLNGLSAVYRIRIRKFFGLPDPDLLVRRGTVRIRILPSFVTSL
jgi:hypothetical protein